MLKVFYPHEYVDSVFAIDFNKIIKKGYCGVIFDIDNTLVHHGTDSTKEIDDLFQEIHSIGLKTLLLSNNNEERIQRFLKNIDSLYICDADKPGSSPALGAGSGSICEGDSLTYPVRSAKSCPCSDSRNSVKIRAKPLSGSVLRKME